MVRNGKADRGRGLRVSSRLHRGRERCRSIRGCASACSAAKAISAADYIDDLACKRRRERGSSPTGCAGATRCSRPRCRSPPCRSPTWTRTADAAGDLHPRRQLSRRVRAVAARGIRPRGPADRRAVHRRAVRRSHAGAHRPRRAARRRSGTIAARRSDPRSLDRRARRTCFRPRAAPPRRASASPARRAAPCASLPPRRDGRRASRASARR